MFELVTIAVCLSLNAILSCFEMAFVTVSKPYLRKLAQQGDKISIKLLTLRANPERVLSVLQIGITLVGAISAAIGGAGAEEYLSPFYQGYLGISEEPSETLAIFTVVVPLTYFSVVIGELVPKTLALRFPLKFARLSCYVLIFLDKLFSPLVYVLELSTRLFIYPLTKKMGSETLHEQTSAIDIDDLTDSHKQYVVNLIAIDKKKVKDILLPWEAVSKLPTESHYTEVIDMIRSTRHTRMPVVENDMPVGILHSKEFISEVEITRMNWKELIRPALFFGPDEPLLSALRQLQIQKSHLAIIRKNNKILGIVTIEDIFEEVVGEIYDEDDNPKKLLSTNSKIRTMHLPKG